MSNMSYCRMENTYRDLQECVENWEETKSESELKYRNKIIKLAGEITEAFGEEKDN